MSEIAETTKITKTTGANSKTQAEKEELQHLLELRELDKRCNPLKYYKACSAKHEEMHKSEAHITALFGGNSSGKTVWLVVQALRAALNQDPYREWQVPNHGRLVTPDFEHGVEEDFMPIIREFCPRNKNGRLLMTTGKNSRGHISKLRFYNGSQIEFTSHKQDFMSQEGVKRDWIGFNEPPPQNIFNASKSRLMKKDRSINKRGYIWMAMTLLSEPWIIEDIYEQQHAKNSGIKCEILSVYDRGDLTREQQDVIVHEMSIGLTSEEKRVRIFGDFINFGGRVYSVYRDTDPWVVKPFRIPKDWQIIESIDPHDGKPTAVVWIAVDPHNDRLYIIKDMYDHTLRTVSQIAEGIQAKRREEWGDGRLCFNYAGENGSYTIIDPSADYERRLVGINYRDEFARCGIRTRKIRKPDVAASIKKMEDLLRLDEDDKPRLMVFETCSRVRYEFMHYIRDPEDGSIRKTNDDCMDDIRYTICSVPVGKKPLVIRRWSDYRKSLWRGDSYDKGLN